MKRVLSLTLLLACLTIFSASTAQRKSSSTALLADSIFAGLEFRNIGPAFMSGRIADIAIHPEDDNVWYIAVGSGGVWKTINAGVTWTPVFDNEQVYSIGCVTIDPNNPHRIWVGTGENIGGRHVGFGDGIYRSEDGGSSWENMGLNRSEHISKIVVHPGNSNIIWAAVQGPLWTKGGERGLYKSLDGGNSWRQVLGNSEWTGVTDLVIDPRNPDVLHAATWDRHRTVAAYMGGGPGTGIHTSIDGGETWVERSSGLPESNMGKIGISLSPQNPDVIYAAIELDLRTGAVYKSVDRGASWEKQSDAVSGGTGPHYYQELYASPHEEGRLFLMNNYMLSSDDGGKNFYEFNRAHKHVDNHAIAFRKDDPDYLLVGTDGGLYESFDHGANWRHMSNLPITQYYKVALDDAEPFYNVYGGTQDNNTQGGPSRTDNLSGIRNADWTIVLGGDGHQPATEPGNPDIVYAQSQQGFLSRIDRTTGEIVGIQPQPAEGEDYERFNWDAPILVSPHSPTTLFHASQRVWKSENRGDSWTAISADLTRNQDRINLPIMGKTWGFDAAWDVFAMSNYNSITSLAQSPKDANLIYAGTDDGLIQITEDGGSNWRKVEAGTLPGVPSTAFVNDIKADLYDANTAYIALDNHKYGDYSPYLLKTNDKGRTWKSIASNIPENHLVWRLVQDHVKPELLFAAVEFGIFFSINGGDSWNKLIGGIPTISFRDLAIQRRENDLVGASFGRGFFILDDYSSLREFTQDDLNKEAVLYSTRKAWWYFPRPVLSYSDIRGSQGADHYVAPNPPFGAVFTYHLSQEYKSKRKIRRENEMNMADGADISFPGWDGIEQERKESYPRVWLSIKDAQGNAIRRIEGPVTKGIHRVSWDLRYPALNIIEIVDRPKIQTYSEPKGMMVGPGTYTATLLKEVNGEISVLTDPVEFEVVPMREGALKGSSPEETSAFWKEINIMNGKVSSLALQSKNEALRIAAIKKAIALSTMDPGDLDQSIHALQQKWLDFEVALEGNLSKKQLGEKNNPTLSAMVSSASRGVNNSTYGPTITNVKSLEQAKARYQELRKELDLISTEIMNIENVLNQGVAPDVER